MRNILPLLFTICLLACSPRGDFLSIDQIPPEKAALAASVSNSEAIYVGTNRIFEDGSFGFGRSEQMSFRRFDILVPKTRELGDLKWPRSAKRADPTTDFLTARTEVFADKAAFSKDLRAAMTRRGQSDVVVYVHGFNNTLAESVYRVAQMHHDLKVPGVAVHYAWPSRGSALGYVYDRDSALFGRDGMELLLQQVAQAGARNIFIVAHSMGSAVTMETLRQADLRKDRKVLDRVSGVILISPDLDVDLFHAQAKGMSKLPDNFMIFGSHRDGVLGLSSRLAGMNDRLGNLKDPSRLSDLKVTYLDTAAYNKGSGHFNLGTSPALLQLLGGIGSIDAAFRAEAAARVGLLPGAVLTMRNATSIVLAPVERVAIGN